MSKEKTFEESLQQLEDIIEKLESQNTSLDEALKLFSEGVLLSDACSKKLEFAKQSVYSLIEKNGTMEKVEFSEDEQ